MKPTILAFFLTAILPLATRAADYLIIANPDVTTAELTREEAKSILLGNKSKWDGGGVIKLVILGGGPAYEKMVSDILTRSPDQYEKYLKKQVFTGKGVMPEVMKNDAEMIAFVSKTSGSLGVVAAETSPSGVKVLTLK